MGSELPYLIQGSTDPAFRGTARCEAVFLCENCEFLLIENYIPEDYVGVGIQCFRCAHVSTTPADLDGEVFSASVVTLGDNGRFLLESTVSTSPDVTITTDAAYTAALLSMRPRDGLSLTLSREGLDEAVAIYERISPGLFNLQESILARTNDADPLKFPFAWAIRYFRRCFDSGELNIDRVESQTAFLWLRLFLDAVGSWQHHPRFPVVGKDMTKPDSFLHTVGQLLTAKYLFEAGNQIGLSLEDQAGHSNPDLYIRSAPFGRIHLEVKAPRKLQSVDQAPIDLGFAKATLKQVIDRSKRQINKHHKGALVIISSLHDDNSPRLLRQHTENWLQAHGRTRKSLAAIVIVSTIGGVSRQYGKDLSQTHGLSFDPVLNPHFDGPNPITVNPG